MIWSKPIIYGIIGHMTGSANCSVVYGKTQTSMGFAIGYQIYIMFTRHREPLGEDLYNPQNYKPTIRKISIQYCPPLHHLQLILIIPSGQSTRSTKLAD
jgi:hypothetical protein